MGVPVEAYYRTAIQVEPKSVVYTLIMPGSPPVALYFDTNLAIFVIFPC